MRKRFLVLSASTGNGHHSAGNALVSELLSRGHEAEMVDCMDHVPVAFRHWFKGGYEMLVRRNPRMWGHLYKTSDKPYLNYWVQTWLDRTWTYPIDEVIRLYKPDWVVCTHSVAQPRLPSIRKELGCKVAVVVTDLRPHRMWLRGKPDYFFVPTPFTEKILYERLPYTKGHTDVVGIPIHPAFTGTVEYDRSPNTLLLSSGGIGAGPFEDVIERLSHHDVNIQVVAGRSKAAKDRLTSLFGSSSNVEIFGHVAPDKMADMMRRTTLLIGKSGGLTTFEALATGTPFLIYKPFLIPGQEEDNARWLDDIGAGQLVLDPEALEQTVDDLLANPASRARMTASGIENAYPDAAQMISDRLEELSRSSRTSKATMA